MTKKYYKIVSRDWDRDSLVSMTYNWLNKTDIPTVEYLVNNWVYPKIGKLFVFDDLEAAKKYERKFHCGSVGGSYIYECEVKNPRTITRIMNLTEKTLLLKFWQNYKNKKSFRKIADQSSILWPVPQGSYVVDAVKLTKKVRG